MKVERETIIKLELSGSAASALAALILSFTPRKLDNALERLKIDSSVSEQLFDLAVLIQDDPKDKGNVQSKEIEKEPEMDLFYESSKEILSKAPARVFTAVEKKEPDSVEKISGMVMDRAEMERLDKRRQESNSDKITVGDHQI